MTARILVVDDIKANVCLLEAKLTAEYFDVVTATNGIECLDAISRHKPDIVLLDVMMPGMDGIETCRRIKSNPSSQHIPVIIVTALDQTEDRVRGLNAGADDFLTKPVNDLALLCRIKSLAHHKIITDELMSRANANPDLAFVMPKLDNSLLKAPGQIALIDKGKGLFERIQTGIDSCHRLNWFKDPEAALRDSALSESDLIVVNMDFQGYDGLRVCSQLRSLEATRQIPVLCIVEPNDDQRLMRALDLGVNDYLIRPIDKQELLARVNTQIKRRRFTEELRHNVQQSMELAVTDPLTGLYNRRHLENQLALLIDQAENRGIPFSILAIDVDHFKRINDTHGHDIGDEVLKELSHRFKDSSRGLDLVCRSGGEEFIIVLSDTEMEAAGQIAERFRKTVQVRPFITREGTELSLTVSIGVSSFEHTDDCMEGLLKRADTALYEAKHKGRNLVISTAA